MLPGEPLAPSTLGKPLGEQPEHLGSGFLDGFYTGQDYMGYWTGLYEGFYEGFTPRQWIP